MSSNRSIGAMNQLADALDAAGFTSEDVTKLKQSDLQKILDILHDRAEIKTIEHLIDCDTQPFVPENWKVEEHRKGGQWKFDPQKISLYLSKKQNKGMICGNDLRQELADKPVLNANVLDYLLVRVTLIPKEWKDKYVFFWGTIYRDADGGLCVRCLHWGGSQWGWDYNWLDGSFNSNNPAALAS
ncbi:MAG: hypothetical protein PHO56_04660 [Patescibacteria group bacterium]|nr:hypothetical protein [Patescibacteria group bacterium]